MQSAAPAVISSGFIYFSLFLVYLTVSLLAFRYLLPGLSAVANRLAMFMLIAQIALVGLSLFLRPASAYEQWLWDMDREHNLISALAAAQFALVGCFALLAAWFSPRPAWRRIYFAGIGILFLALSWDEYHSFRSVHGNWQIYYVSLGLVVASATVLVALRSPRRVWKWFFCFLSGLAISALGALILDIVPCNGEIIYLAGTWRVDKDACILLKHIEEALELVGIWLALVAAGGLATIARAGKGIPRIMYLVPPLSILVLLLHFLPPLLELRLMTQEASIGFETGINLQAFRVDMSPRRLDTTLFVSSTNWHKFTGKGYSIHLVDLVSGESIAHTDDSASRREGWRTALYVPGVNYIQRISVDIPADAPANRAMQAVLTVWSENNGAFIRQKVKSSDLPLLSDTQVILNEFVLTEPISSDSTPLAAFENGFALASARLPESAKAGDTIDIMFFWSSDKEGLEDTIQFLHFSHEESGGWWGYDQRPLGPRLPTRLWYSGLSDSELWQAPQPDDLPAGSYAVFTGLYDPRDGERVPAHDANGEPFLDARVPLGIVVVQAA